MPVRYPSASPLVVFAFSTVRSGRYPLGFTMARVYDHDHIYVKHFLEFAAPSWHSRQFRQLLLAETVHEPGVVGRAQPVPRLWGALEPSPALARGSGRPARVR